MDENTIIAQAMQEYTDTYGMEAEFDLSKFKHILSKLVGAFFAIVPGYKKRYKKGKDLLELLMNTEDPAQVKKLLYTVVE